MKSKSLALYAVIVNPILNLMAFYYTDVFYENQTHVGNALHHPLYFFMWTISSCFGYYYFSKCIWESLHISYSKIIHLMLNAGIVVSIFIPYADTLPFWINDGHVWLAILCIGGFMIEWLYIAIHSILQYKKEWKQLFAIFILCIFLLVLFGHVTAFAEISFSTLVNLYLYYWSKKEESFS